MLDSILFCGSSQSPSEKEIAPLETLARVDRPLWGKARSDSFALISIFVALGCALGAASFECCCSCR